MFSSDTLAKFHSKSPMSERAMLFTFLNFFLRSVRKIAPFTAPSNVQIKRMCKCAFAPNINYRLSDCGPPGVGLERNGTVRHDTMRVDLRRAGQGVRYRPSGHPMPPPSCFFRLVTGGGLLHAEAGDLRGQMSPDPQTGSGASMSLGDVADLSMSLPTIRQNLRDSWGCRRRSEGECIV